MGAAFSALTTSRVARMAAVVAVALASAVAFAATSAAQDKTIRTMGTEDVHINSKIFSNLRFSPGNTTLNSGDQLTLSHADKTDEPHTLTIVDASEVPSDVEGVFGCGAPGTVCDEVFTTVGPQITDETQSQFINVAGGSGLDGRLDTLWLPPGTSITVPVTAPSGTTLSYFCAIHAWMQGSITVR
jgi:plastocyanin